MLTNEHPFDGDDFGEISDNNIAGKVVKPAIKLTPEFSTLIAQTMSIDPEKRPSIDQILQTPWIKKAIEDLKKMILN